jgi:putative ABC transport system permease protein
MNRPPRLAVWLLETFLPEEQRDAVIGDLVESHVKRQTSNAGAFWREALFAIAQLQLLPASASAFTPHTQESFMQSFLSDIRHAARVLNRNRAFMALCVLTLGVAIGATTAIYSVVNPVLLRGLPYPDANRVVMVSETSDNGPSRIGYATYLDLRNSSKTLQHSAVVGFWQPTIFGDRDAERVRGQVVSWEFFRVLGIHPVMGRDFEQADDALDRRNVVLLGHGLWTRRFGADPAIVGKTINMGTVTRQVIGVLPASFDNVLDPVAEIYRPLGYSLEDNSACRTCRHLQMIGRVKPTATLADAELELDGLLKRVIAEHPKDYSSKGAVVDRMQDRVTQASRPVLWALLGAAVLVLLIAAANVTNLQLARAVRRQGEFAVRAALGAGRGRIARQLVAEGIVLSALSGALGIAIATVTLPMLTAQLPANMPRLSAISVDWRAMGAVATVVLAVGIGVGLVAAFGGHFQLYDALRGGRAVAGSRHRIRTALVAGEVALALMLVVGSGLLGRSLMRLLAVNPGFDPTHLVTMEVQATGPKYDSAYKVFANHDRIREAVRAIPGVEDVGLSTMLPLGGNFDRYGVTAQDKPLDNPELGPSADRYTVSAGFLSAMRIPILRGRSFTDAEANDSSIKLAVVSASLAKRIWAGENPIGKLIRMGGPTRPWKTVIGVSGDVRHTGLDATETYQVYAPERQWYYEENIMALAVRVSGDPATMISAIREAVRSVDPLQPIAKIATMENVVSTSTAQRQLGLLLFVAFGAIALILAAAGIYGVLAGSVAERTREFGLRTALGAAPGSIVGLVLRQAGGVAGAGLVVGLGAALALSRYLRALLYGVGPTDPVAVALAVVVLAVVALVACVVPARRAVRVDPMAALRAD